MPLLSLSVSQFMWIFVATNILKKLRPNILFLNWLASGNLTCFKVPDNADLRKLRSKDSGDAEKIQSKSARTSKQADGRSHDGSRAEFTIKSADLINLELKKVKVWPWMLQNTPYGDELEMVVDFSFMALISFIVLELIFYYSPKTSEYNVSLMWILLVIFQCLYILLRLTSIYFRNQDSMGERSICIVSGCVFLLLAMLIITFDGRNRADLGMNKALDSWIYGPHTKSSNNSLLDPDEIETPPSLPTPRSQVDGGIRPTSTIVFKFLVAIICALLGATFTFPGFRFGQLHESFLAGPDTSLWQRVLYNFNYLSPALVICLWIPAISSDLLKKQRFILIEENEFELLRIGVLVLVNISRFALVRTYTETFLNSGTDRIKRLRYRGGTTTNKHVQMTIVGINNYVSVVGLQYILPTLICLFTSIMYAALSRRGESSGEPAPVELQKISSLRNMLGEQAFILAAEQIINSTRELLASDVPKNLASFATWWLHCAWLCSSTAGVVYHKYFNH